MSNDKVIFGSAAILAGGKSVRFGEDKALIPFGPSSLIEHIISQLKDLFNNIIIISNEPEKYKFCGLNVQPDLIPGIGPLGGIHTALMNSESRYLFVTACDMPFISSPLISLMKQAAEARLPEAVTAAPGGFIEPLHAIYSRELTGKIEASAKTGSNSIFTFTSSIDTFLIANEQLKELNIDRSFFTSINSRADLQKITFPIK